MGRLSLLPESLIFFESAISWLFIALAIVTIGPWLLVLIYDLLLYVWRSLTFDIPLVGGAARGKRRPRAPSLSTRPDGHRRRFSLVGLSGDVKPVDLMTTTTTIPEEESSGDEVMVPGQANDRNDSVVGDQHPVTEQRHRKAHHAGLTTHAEDTAVMD